MLGRLGDLEVVDAGRNELTHVPQELCRLRRLTELRVPGNMLRGVPDGLSQLPLLKVLDLSSNKLDEAPFQGRALATGAMPLVVDNLMCGIKQPSGEVYHLLEARLRFEERKREEEARAAGSPRQGRSPHGGRSALSRLRRVVRNVIVASRWPVKAAYKSSTRASPRGSKSAVAPSHYALHDLRHAVWCEDDWTEKPSSDDEKEGGEEGFEVLRPGPPGGDFPFPADTGD